MFGLMFDAIGYFKVEHEMFDANGNFHGKGLPCLRLAADGAPLHLLPVGHGRLGPVAGWAAEC
jgi:hypothetical protein